MPLRRLIILSFLCHLFFASSVFSRTDVFRAGAVVEYILDVNEPQVISNVFLWPVRAVCHVSSHNESNLLSFTVLRKSGSLNGQSLKAGDSMEILVRNHDKFYITAVAGAQVELVNNGEETMIASCSAN